jgi:group II intron reverse transcriptase/maturase
MIKTTISLQELRKRIYCKAKSGKTHKFWGLYCHVIKMETIEEAYYRAKAKKGAPGIDGVTFKDIGKYGEQKYLEEIRKELAEETYQPQKNRKVEIPKGNGKTRTLGIPTIRDRVVQGALKLILEVIFEADFQEGSYGYRPKKTQHQAFNKVCKEIIKGKTEIINLDLQAYFDTVKHDKLLKKIAERVIDDKVMRLIKMILKASGKEGVPQGGVISPLFANLYLNEVDKMLERAKAYTKQGEYTEVEYVRFADDLVVMVQGHKSMEWLLPMIDTRLRQEFDKLGVTINEEKTKKGNIDKGFEFSFVGFSIRRKITRDGKKGLLTIPLMKKRNELLEKLRNKFERLGRHGILQIVINEVNEILQGWANYFRVGNSAKCFSYIKGWVEKKVRRYMMRTRGKRGFGWKRWSKEYIYDKLGLYNNYKVEYI